MRANGSLTFLLTDHLGSTSLAVTAAGTLSSEQRYTAFGQTRYAMGDLPTTYEYTGQRNEKLIGLYFYRARWYDPGLGRFIQPDTVIQNPGDPQAYNRYTYVSNNPLRYNDPTGHFLDTVLDIASIGYDIYDIAANGLNWGSGLALAADVAGLALPFATGGGLLVRAATHADDAVDAVRAVNAAQAANRATDVARTANQAGDLAQVSNRAQDASGASRRFWTRTTDVNGTRVYQRNDLINPNLTDASGFTNRARMAQGWAPIMRDGGRVELHHMLQTQAGPIAEVAHSFHSDRTIRRIIHINPNTIRSGINRARFDRWREAYWRLRALDF